MRREFPAIRLDFNPGDDPLEARQFGRNKFDRPVTQRLLPAGAPLVERDL